MGLAQLVVPISGATRESFTVNEEETGLQYRFVLPGPSLSEMEQRRCLLDIGALSPAPSYLVVSGGFPPGADEARLSAEIAELAAAIGARLILDTSQAMLHAPEKGTFLMKPSLSELARMLGREITGRDGQIDAARSIVEDGRAEVVVVSLGEEGALLVADGIAEHFAAPPVPEKSAVGAGDSMVGAMVLALQRGWDLRQVVRYGVAAGTATIMTPGTELCHRDDVERLFNEMSAAA